MNLLKLKFKTTEFECTHTFNIFPLLFQHNKRRKNISDNFISKQIQFSFLNIFNKKNPKSMFLPQAGPRDIPIAIIEVPDEPDARQYKVQTS